MVRTPITRSCFLQIFSVTFLPQRRGATFKSPPNFIAYARIFSTMNNPDLEKLKPWCQSHGVDLCVLFGSQATGRTHARSDVDVALFSASQPDMKKDLLRLMGELEDQFGQPVDLVIIEPDTDPVLRLEVFQHGQPLYESRSGLFNEHRVLAVKIFDDTEPLRRIRDRVLAERILNLKYVDKEKYVIHPSLLENK